MFWLSAVLVTHKNIPKIQKLNGVREVQETENYFVEYTLNIIITLQTRLNIMSETLNWQSNQSNVILFLWF